MLYFPLKPDLYGLVLARECTGRYQEMAFSTVKDNVVVSESSRWALCKSQEVN